MKQNIKRSQIFSKAFHMQLIVKQRNHRHSLFTNEIWNVYIKELEILQLVHV